MDASRLAAAGWLWRLAANRDKPRRVDHMDENVLVSVLGCMGRTGCTPLV